MLVLSPTMIEWTSPLTTALNHTVQFSPISTCPITVAFSARKQFFPNFGVYPLTDFINAIASQSNFKKSNFYSTDKMSFEKLKLLFLRLGKRSHGEFD